VIGLLLLWVTVVPCQETSQKIDPFYLQRLDSGERAFMEGDYGKAVEELKIALFGIQEDLQLQAKANFYLGLSYYYLDNTAEAKIRLKEAKDYLGIDGLRALVTDESVWFYFNRVLADLELTEDVQKKPTGMVIPQRIPGEKQARETRAESVIENLEQQIKSNPQNVSLYYDLYKYYKEDGNTKEAKKTLKDLIRRKPTEAKAFYLLGRIQYELRDLKDADRKLRRVFTLQKTVPVDEYVLLEARAYHILNTYLSGDRLRSYQMFAEWADQFTDEKIRYLDLEEKDRAIFMGIAHAEETQAEIERLAIEAQGSVREQAG
jgi:tetratricopeptide (TPR) repeat protein